MRGPLLLLLIMGVSGVYSGHSLRHFQTMFTAPEKGRPEYISVFYVDKIQISHYSSDSREVVPTTKWMEKVPPQYWEIETQRSRRNEAELRHTARVEMMRVNHTGGFHIVQWMYGCDLRDDGSSRGYAQFGYDGKDFLILDPEQWVFIPITDLAQITTQRLNSPEERLGERYKNYLHVCIDWLKKHLENGKGVLDRKVRPEVTISGQNVNGVTKLHCQVYGFYPRDVDVNWKRNGLDVPSYERKQILPNTDSTYQIRVTVEVLTNDRDGYSCHVDHASLDQTLTVKWEPQSSSNTLWIVIAVLAGVLAIAAIGFIIWRISSVHRQDGIRTETFPIRRSIFNHLRLQSLSAYERATTTIAVTRLFLFYCIYLIMP
uniref:Ig-like domain-containing protein n=1 Tax=Leptobrachium leishanense TaxID=445787 RepID=A0A8C5MKB8_9ANUR